MEKGDLGRPPSRRWTQAAQPRARAARCFYNLAEIKAAKNQTDEAVGVVPEGAGRRIRGESRCCKLGTLAMNKGDKARPRGRPERR